MHPLRICYVVKIIQLHCLCSLSVVIKFKKYILISEEYLKNFIIVMEAVTHSVRWEMLYADDLVLVGKCE